MASSIEEARRRYIEERPSYEILAKRVELALLRRLAEAHIPCSVESRAKTVSSFVKKTLTTTYGDIWEEMPDKAGARVIFEHSGDLELGIQIARELFPDSKLENERFEEGFEQRLSYPKTHLHVRVLDKELNPDYMSCEIQLRTAAEDLWSRMSHALLYKPSAPSSPVVRRSLYRLLALVELYDAEVERAMTDMTSNPAFEESQLLHSTEALYHEFVASDYRLALSQEIIPVLLELIDKPIIAYTETLEEFSKSNRPKLAEFFREYGPESASGLSGQNILATQPECIIIFEIISRKPEALRAKWEENQLPEDWLSELSGSWGIHL
ncbi:hypothetical protein ACIRU2_03930 [Streptomyces sp. NPDC101169]|uniref:hypothetical protein n=1 Tax=Streptomyces sp. NPDC101169 TaxID=3366121 RepID=UPI0038223035